MQQEAAAISGFASQPRAPSSRIGRSAPDFAASGYPETGENGMGTRIVFQRRRETDSLLNDEPSEDPYFIAKLFGMAFISGGNSGYALNSVGFVLARLVRDAPAPLPEGLIGSIAYCGIFVGCPLGGLLARRVGRRVATLYGELMIIFACVVGAIGGPATVPLVFWRLLVGAGVGICITVKPLYLAELSPDEHRGKILAGMGVANALSVMGAHTVDYIADGGSGSLGWWWRFEALSGAFLPVFLLLLLRHMPESPVYLAAAAASEDAEEDVAESKRLATVRWKSIGLCVALDVVRECTGGPVVSTYAKQIYMGLRADDDPASLDLAYGLSTIGCFVVGNAATFALVDRVGRRPPLLMGCAGVALAMGVFSVAGSPAALVFFGLGFGGIFATWTILLPELLLPRDRARLIGWLMALPFVFSLAEVYSYPLFAARRQLSRAAFASFAIIAAVLGGVLHSTLPETLGVPLGKLWDKAADDAEPKA